MEATAKELMLPGTMVLLHTPQGEFVFGYGATELGVAVAISALSAERGRMARPAVLDSFSHFPHINTRLVHIYCV